MTTTIFGAMRNLSNGSGRLQESFVDPELACRNLEKLVAELQSRVVEPSGKEKLRAARQQASLARAWREQAALQYPAAQRARRTAQSKLQEVRGNLHDALEANARQEKDNFGLLRTLAGLQKRMQKMQIEVAHQKGEADKADEQEESLRMVDLNLQRSVGSMGDVQKVLEDRLQEERQKRLELKASMRAKIQRVEQEHAVLKLRAAEQTAELEVWKQRLAEQNDATRAALEKLFHCQTAAEGAAKAASQKLAAKQEMHAQFMHIQKVHRELHRDVEETQKLLDKEIQEEAEVQGNWRLDHLARVDAWVEARKCRDREIVIAS
eukprot:TRINITY_DN4728_c0_g4_i1.p1 TRINITY_DN4728_c0_g4~~TRINITY_DN4728_c0_g4_i1.p1  ORF type:complete len:322 (+),score=95.72 TRINITY_DN4728_c0_g4_i1:100-1065(+)